MTYKNIIYVFALFVILPAWIGILWVEFLKIRGKLAGFLNAWVLGLVTMLGVGQLILVPMVAMEQSLTNAVMVWKIVLTIPGLMSFFLALKWMRPMLLGEQAESTCAQTTDLDTGDTQAGKGRLSWKLVLCILAVILIFMQAYILAKYQHIDDDDSRFIAEEVSAVVHDTMLIEDPITVDFMYWDLGEVRKDLTSPWTMYVAMYCRIADVPPAVFSHTLFPFFMIIICYVVYGMIGSVLLKKDMEKVFLFLIFLSVIHIWGYTSTHTLGSMILLRIWQGKAVVAGFIIPLLFYLFYQILLRKENQRWAAVLYVVSFAGSLLSGIGIVVVPVMVALYGIVDVICHRNWKKTLTVWLAATPCCIYLGYYLMGLY